MSDADLDQLVDAETAAMIRRQDKNNVSELDVLPENWPALQLFLSCCTQWRYAPLGGIVGLDYQALSAVMEMQQIPPLEKPHRLNQVQWIERGALDALNKKKK